MIHVFTCFPDLAEKYSGNEPFFSITNRVAVINEPAPNSTNKYYRVRVFEPNGTPPGGFERVTPTLEDAYLMLMRSDPDRPGQDDVVRDGTRPMPSDLALAAG